jgi:hypothetical protein
VGAQECIDLPEYKPESSLFSYFSKYMCLKVKNVEMDITAKNCIEGNINIGNDDYF